MPSPGRFPFNSSYHWLIKRYEELREQGRRNSPRHHYGLALFLNRGMAAWSYHWLSCTEHKDSEDFASDNTKSPQTETKILKPVITDQVMRDITELIATMALEPTESRWIQPWKSVVR